MELLGALGGADRGAPILDFVGGVEVAVAEYEDTLDTGTVGYTTACLPASVG